MAKNTLYPQLCKCDSPSCGQEKKIYMWTSDVDTFTKECDLCKSGSLIPHEQPTINLPAIVGLHKERNLQQRRKRNHEHFKKEVLPTITDSDTKKHFNKKLSIKL